MLTRLIFAATALSVVAGCSTISVPTVSNVTPKRYAVRDFFSNPEQAYFRLSEDGQTLGFMKPHEKRMNIHVQPATDAGTDRNVRRLTAETARDISNYDFKGSQYVLYQKDFGGDENFHIVSVDIRSGAIKDLTPHDGVRASVVDSLVNDPEHVLVEHNRRDKKVFDVYKINIATGQETLVAQNPGNFVSWVTDHEGVVRFGIAADGVNTTFFYREGGQNPFREIARTNFREGMTLHHFTADNKKLYVTSNRGRDKAAVFVFDPSTAKEEQLLFEHNEVDVHGLAWSEKRKVLTHATYQTDKSHEHFFDDETRTLYATLQRKFPGDEVTIQSMSRDEQTMIVAAYNDRTQGARYLYDRRGDHVKKLAEINKRINPTDMASMKPIRFTARDGLVINGYLTLPLGEATKNLPVVINPHGGPWARDSWGYNPEVQLLANRGYAVLQINFRGSTGYGRKFWEASFKQWGGTMQDDITDGVNWLVAQGIADPKRIAIYGASYGGYATLSGVTKTPDLYAAAINYVGVSNLHTFLNTIPPYWLPFREMMFEMVGHPEKDKALFDANSPALNAHKIKTPLFVAQGAKDPRVNKAESDQIVDALRKRGVAVEYMVKDNEGHGFANEENRFEFYDAMEKFLAKHLAKK